MKGKIGFGCFLLTALASAMVGPQPAYGVPDSCPASQLIVPTGAGVAQGSIWFPMEDAFDAQPTLSSSGVPVGGSGGSDGPYLPNRAGYIDFGPHWEKVRITSTWTQYRTWSLGDQTPYIELWWDDDTDSVNDGISETQVNFNSAQDLETVLQEPWLRDRDLCLEPVAPQARYLLARAPEDMTNRAKEYAILGYLSRKGMTWAKMSHHPDVGVDHVGCEGCDPYEGDTSCDTALPVLCIQPSNAVPPEHPFDFYNGWISGTIALTEPVRGDQLLSLANADTICTAALGEGYQMAEFHHPEGGWSWSSYGNVSSATRFWVHINDQPANCWSP